MMRFNWDFLFKYTSGNLYLSSLILCVCFSDVFGKKSQYHCFSFRKDVPNMWVSCDVLDMNTINATAWYRIQFVACYNVNTQPPPYNFPKKLSSRFFDLQPRFGDLSYSGLHTYSTHIYSLHTHTHTHTDAHTYKQRVYIR